MNNPGDNKIAPVAFDGSSNSQEGSRKPVLFDSNRLGYGNSEHPYGLGSNMVS